MHIELTVVFAVAHSSTQLRFHPIHGENIEISPNRTRAKRTKSFYHGITFSDRPLHPNEVVHIKFLQMSYGTQESFRFGFTHHDPVSFGNSLPLRAPSAVRETSRFWTMLLEERFFRIGRVFFYYFTTAGSVHYGIDGIEKGVFKIPPSQKTLWAVVDVHGKCSSVEFLDRNDVNRLPQTSSELNNNLFFHQNGPHSSSSLNYDPFKPPLTRSSVRAIAGTQQVQPDILSSVRHAVSTKNSKARPIAQQRVGRTATVTSNGIPPNPSKVQQIGAMVENSMNQAVLNYVRTVRRLPQQQQALGVNFPASNHNRATVSLNQIKDIPKTRPKFNQHSSQPTTSSSSRNALSTRNMELVPRRDTVKAPPQPSISNRDRLEALSKNMVTLQSSLASVGNTLEKKNTAFKSRGTFSQNYNAA